MDPRVRLSLSLLVGVLAVTLDRPHSLGLLALLSGAPLLLLPAAAAWRRRVLVGIALIVWGTMLSQGLFYADEPRVALLHIGPLTLWREGMVYGLTQSLRFVAVSCVGAAVALSTAPDRLFAALLWFRVPFGLAFLTVTALRFVPDIGQELLTVREARARRGRPLHHRTPWAWLALEVAMLRPVVARALRRARALAESLDARGFDPAATRTLRRPLSMHPAEAVGLSIGAGIVLTAVALRVLYTLYTSEILYIPALRPLYGFVRTWM